MNYKCFTPISKNKFDKFNDKQKRSILFKYFMEIEEILSFQNKQYNRSGGACLRPFKTNIRSGGACLRPFKTNNRSGGVHLRPFTTNNRDGGVHLRPIIDIKTFTENMLLFGFNLSPENPIPSAYNLLRDSLKEDIILQKDSHFLKNIRVHDRQKSDTILPIIIILDNLRSAFNVGSIIRTAECLNIYQIWFCGYTPLPSHPKVANTAMGTEKKIDWLHFDNTAKAIKRAKEMLYKVYALETMTDSETLYQQNFEGYISFVLGNEALGISLDIINLCDKCINLPVFGWKNSLNVATACTVACYEVLRQNNYS